MNFNMGNNWSFHSYLIYFIKKSLELFFYKIYF